MTFDLGPTEVAKLQRSLQDARHGLLLPIYMVLLVASFRTGYRLGG